MKEEDHVFSSDQQLIAKVLNGDKHAFAILIRQTEGLVAKIVFQMTGSTDDRKDLVQEIYIRAYQNLAGFEFRSKLSTWIGQIAYHTCLQYLKKKKLCYLEDISEESYAADIAYLERETHLFQKDLSDILLAAVARLPPLYRTLITLYHQEELRYEEIREVTGLPEGTIKNYLFRARKALRNDLLKRYKKEEL